MSRIFLVFLLCLPAAAQSKQGNTDLERAVSLQQAGKYPDAIEAYERFLRSHPEAAGVRSNLGAALAHEGRFEEAIREYTVALTSDPANQPVRVNLALAYYKSGEILHARGQLEKVNSAAPGNKQVALLLAACYLSEGENLKVVALLDPMVSVTKSDMATTYLMGTALMRANQTARGQLWLDKILRNGESADSHFLMATAPLSASDANGARNELMPALEMNPKLPQANSYLGLTLLRTGDTTAAADAFRRELQVDPHDFDSNL